MRPPSFSSSNDGSRASRFALDAYATGEITGEDRAAFEARLTDADRAHLAALALAKERLPPFDAAALRARAQASLPSAVVVIEDDEDLVQGPANDNVGFKRQIWGLVAALAAAVLFAVLLPWGADPVSVGPDATPKGADTLLLSTWNGRNLQVYSVGTPLGEGDKLGLQVSADDHRGVVILSVDGSGMVSVYYPDPSESGTDSEPLSGEGLVPLPGSIVLDGAQGPEVFVAVFDRPVSEARAQVTRVFEDGGHQGLLDWATRTDDVDAVEVTRR